MASLPYLDFTVHLRPDPRGGALARVVHAAAGGGGSASLQLPWGPLEIDRMLHALSISPHDPEPEEGSRLPTAASLGRLLSDQLFQGRIRDAFLKSKVAAAVGGYRGLRLRLAFDLEEEAAEGDPPTFRHRSLALAALPWELTLDPETGRPLARNRETPLSRLLGVRAAAPRRPLGLPLRVLLVGAGPNDYPPLELDEEIDRLRATLEESRGVTVGSLPHCGFGELREKLVREDFHVIHFMGHGDFDRLGAGSLVFEGRSGEADRVPGPLLADTLRGHPALRLMTVNACRGAQFPRREGLDPYAGVATALVEAGFPAVVAMQLPITDGAARAFSAGFYGALAAGDGLDGAMAEGRLAILEADRDSREWATPVLFVPQGAEPLLPSLEAIVDVPEEIRGEIREESTYLEVKTAGFVGRGFLRDALDGFLRAESHGYFLLLGDPGIGKTAFVADLVRRRRCLHHFNRRAEGVVRPEAFLRNLCAQLVLEHRLGHRSLPPRAERDSGFLVELLQQAAAARRHDEKLLVVVDALDEADGDSLPAGANALYLPRHLPAGVFFVVSCRCNVDRLLTVESPCHRAPLAHDSAENLADVREMIGNQLDLPGLVSYRREHRLDEDDFVELLTEKSDGNFMYLHHVLPAIERGELRGVALSEIPKGLDGYYEQHWQRMKLRDEEVWQALGLPVLHLITAAELPLSAEWIDRFLGRPGLARVRSVLNQWKPFLHASRAIAEDGTEARQYSLYHTSFSTFIHEKVEVQDQGPSLAATRELLHRRLFDDGHEPPEG